MERIYKRGEIYFAELGDGVGSEQKGTRPVVIIQNDIGNKHSGTVIVAALTSEIKSKPKLPTHYYIRSNDGLYKDSVVMLEQIRTIDKTRIVCYVGQVSQSQLDGIDKALKLSVGLMRFNVINLCTDCVNKLHSSGAFFFKRDNSVNYSRKCLICKENKSKPYKVSLKL